MWCSNNSSDQHECRTGHMPWADGTPCHYHPQSNSAYQGRTGPDGWCHKGDCVPRDRTLFHPVDGEWGFWQEYGECSRTCGGGVKKAIRLCDSPPPANGGRYCIGQRVRYLSCNTQDCPPGTMDFREQQCAMHNNRKFTGKGLSDDIKWAPKYGGVPLEDRCKLYCRVLSSSAYYRLADKVIDGTPCGPENTYDICVDGACHRTGCDHILDSKTELDICGVCGGDNSTCLQKKGQYNESRYGYTHVVRIPKGASNLDIRQYAYNETVEDNNYIALMDSDSGEYILNGNFIITMFKKLILYEGTTLEYTGSGTVVERVNSSLPLNKDLIIEVLSVKDISPPNLIYEYTVQKNPDLYRWELDDEYTSCNKECHGERWRDFRCIKVDEEQAVAEEMCDDQEKPRRQIVICNTHCSLSWEVVSKSECSTPCGIGERTLTVKCIKNRIKDGKKSSVYDEACSHLLRPPRTENCTGTCDKTGWKYSPWGPCSVTCGDGKMKRTAKCVDSADRERDASECDPNERKLTEVCNSGDCPRWETAEWTPCSVSCGRGKKHRPYFCRVGNRMVNDHSMCAGQEPPVSEEPCDLGPCPYWKEDGPWSPCSATCGDGVSTVNLVCSVPFGCANATKPQQSKHCNVQPCPAQSENAFEYNTFPAKYSWRQKWSACSASCGHGRRTKTTQCYDNSNDRPVEARFCPELRGVSYEVNTCYKKCPQWRTEEWEPCSAICGEGFETRKVLCEGENGEILPDNNCTMYAKPIHERKCKETCHNNHDEGGGQYEVGPWSECSVTCGIGEQYRNVQCRKRFCHWQKPPKVQACNRGPCVFGEWAYGEWSSCNVTCGHGSSHLEVFCKTREGLLVPDKHCPRAKPRIVNTCYEGPCEKPRWRTEKWSACLLTNCTKTRRLYCTLGDERVDDSECADLLRRPKTTRPCKRMCPNGAVGPKQPFVWRPTKWSQCSASCGRGRRTRGVHCIKAGGNSGTTWRRGRWGREHVKDHHCPSPKPRTEEYCEGQNCRDKTKSVEQYTWEPGPWRTCSHPCSKKGKQERTIHCYNAQGVEVPRRFCPKSKKPPNKRKCEEVLCPTCRDLYLLKKEEDPQDGEYTLYPRGPSEPSAKIYCHDMSTGRPREFLTVNSENNYAMVFHENIRAPSGAECGDSPYRGYCGHYVSAQLASGFTVFYKLAINITTLTVIGNDWTFAKAARGDYIPVAEAGDCFSRICPQGSFKISLRETNFAVSRDSKWHTKPSHTYIRINRAEDGKTVDGRCGGCCGLCQPKDGIKLDLAPP
ncbi:a disintegrin and metalloproteinase with thrombospondin motifs [Nesidiocoris tenuis]|uniref:A disintegrin and metalloproteinase with thrombospondin motifs n=1 Tax=Nesidiocoris tenuis TaxID=355587 RepID=A0ABN7B597_9HEMI|nr:a disintegrin and metalloproteinase with thrombospondin motifs [Nesidiocoris tenuis]